MDLLGEKNAAMLDEMIDALDSLDREHAEVIMFIGKSGAGKSAVINTIHQVLTGTRYQIARQGCGKASSVTQTLERYDNCGVHPETIRDIGRKKSIEGILHKLPHIVDCSGLADVNSPYIRELLELMLGGYIPPGTSTDALISLQMRYGTGNLKNIFTTLVPNWMITKVVFVQGCSDAVPKKLIECLTDVLKTTAVRKCGTEVFQLITKYDLVRDHLTLQPACYDDCIMTFEEYVNVKDTIISAFNIVKSPESNTFRWISYTDSIQSYNPYIDNIALKFLKRMFEPGPLQPTPENVFGPMKTLKQHWFQLSSKIPMCFLQYIKLIVIVFVILGLYKLLQ